VQVHIPLLPEPTEQIYARVFREFRPRTPPPEIEVRFRGFANANSFIRLAGGRLEVRISDVLQDAPTMVQEALAFILVAKLCRREVPALYSQRYRRFLNRADIRRKVLAIRQERGRKYLSGPKGDHYDLESMFDDLNFRFFGGMMSMPRLGWSLRGSRTTLGHYDAAHNAIVMSRVLDRPSVPRVAVEYVLYHEMLHLRHPVEHRGARRCVHTPEFKASEGLFPGLDEAKRALKNL
jgi:hypothetical protein